MFNLNDYKINAVTGIPSGIALVAGLSFGAGLYWTVVGAIGTIFAIWLGTYDHRNGR